MIQHCMQGVLNLDSSSCISTFWQWRTPCILKLPLSLAKVLPSGNQTVQWKIHKNHREPLRLIGSGISQPGATPGHPCCFFRSAEFRREQRATKPRGRFASARLGDVRGWSLYLGETTAAHEDSHYDYYDYGICYFTNEHIMLSCQKQNLNW